MKSLDKESTLKFIKSLAKSYRAAGNKEKEFEYKKKAIELGDAETMALVASEYLFVNEWRENLDDSEAFHLAEESYQLGCAFGTYVLAGMHFEGCGVERNIPRTIELLEEAVLHDIPQAKARLGFFLFDGDLVEQDMSRGVRLMEEAWECGEYWCNALNLGKAYGEGLGVKKDIIKSLRFLSEGAENGEEFCRRILIEKLSEIEKEIGKAKRGRV